MKTVSLIVIGLILIVGSASATIIQLNTTNETDGHVSTYPNASYLVTRNSSGELATTGEYSNYARLTATTYTDVYDGLHRAVLLINKSEVVGHTINSVVLVTTGSYKANGLGNFSYSITGFNATNTNGTFVAGDFERFYDERWSDTDIAYSDISDSGFNNWTGNDLFKSNLTAEGDWIGIMVRDVPDIDNNESLVVWANSSSSMYVFEDGETGDTPYLIINHTESAVTPLSMFTKSQLITHIPRNVSFTDESTNTPTSYDWGFGDGTGNMTTMNTSHQYTRPGIYTVWHKSENDGGADWNWTKVWIVKGMGQQGIGEVPVSCEYGTYEMSRELTQIERVMTDMKILELCERYGT